MDKLNDFIRIVRKCTGQEEINIEPVGHKGDYLITILDKIKRVDKIHDKDGVVRYEVYFSSCDRYLEHSANYTLALSAYNDKVYMDKTGIIINESIFDNENIEKILQVVYHIMDMRCIKLLKGHVVNFDDMNPMKVLDRYQDYKNKEDVVVLGDFAGNEIMRMGFPKFNR